MLHTLLPLPRSAPVVVLDYDDWNPQCTWPAEQALGIVTMGAERFDEDAPALPTFRGSAGGSVHGGAVGSRQRVTQHRPTELQVAAAGEAPEAAALLLQLAEALRGLAAHGDMSAHGGGRRGAVNGTFFILEMDCLCLTVHSASTITCVHSASTMSQCRCQSTKHTHPFPGCLLVWNRHTQVHTSFPHNVFPHAGKAANPYAPFAAMTHRASMANLVSLARRANGDVSQSAPPGGTLASTLDEPVPDTPDDPEPSWVGGSMHSVTSAGGLYAQLLAQQAAPGGAMWSPARQRSADRADRGEVEDDRSSTVRFVFCSLLFYISISIICFGLDNGFTFTVVVVCRCLYSTQS